MKNTKEEMAHNVDSSYWNPINLSSWWISIEVLDFGSFIIFSLFYKFFNLKFVFFNTRKLQEYKILLNFKTKYLALMKKTSQCYKKRFLTQFQFSFLKRCLQCRNLCEITSIFRHFSKINLTEIYSPIKPTRIITKQIYHKNTYILSIKIDNP